MSEILPDDSELLAMVQDDQTGVPFIETGKAPYFLDFRRMLYRLVQNLAPLGCRVFGTGPLAAQVKPGRYWLAGQVQQFPGTTADLVLADNATNRLFLKTDNTVAVAPDWPATEHVKLAEIVTANGGFAIANITDLRGAAMLTSLASTLTATPGQINMLNPANGGLAIDQFPAWSLNMLADAAFGLHVQQINLPNRFIDTFENQALIDATNSSGCTYDAVNHLVANLPTPLFATAVNAGQITTPNLAAHLEFGPGDGVADEAVTFGGQGSILCGGDGSLGAGCVIDDLVGNDNPGFYLTNYTSTDWMAMCHVRVTSGQLVQGLFLGWDPNGTYNVAAYLQSADSGVTYHLYVKNFVANVTTDCGTFPTGQDVHFAITQSAGIVRVYVNGTLKGTTASMGACLPLSQMDFADYVGASRLQGNIGQIVFVDKILPQERWNLAAPYGANGMDMVLQSVASTTPAATRADLLLNMALPSGAVLNTDVKGYVSLDGGTTFSQITLSLQGDNGDGSVRLFGSVTGLTSGTSLVCKVAAAGSAGVTQVWDWAVLAGA